MTGIDGTYRPTGNTATGNAACSRTSFGNPIRVDAGVARLQTATQGELKGSVAPDGSLMVQRGPASLRGQFSGNQFNGAYTVRRCEFTLTYTR